MEELEKVFVATIWPAKPSTSTKMNGSTPGQDYKMVESGSRLDQAIECFDQQKSPEIIL